MSKRTSTPPPNLRAILQRHAPDLAEKTNLEIGEAIGVNNPSMVSRLLNGKQGVGSRLRASICNHLARDLDRTVVQRIAHELQPVDGDTTQEDDLLILLAEFRETPRMAEDELVRREVIRKLVSSKNFLYGLFFPFLPSAGETHTEARFSSPNMVRLRTFLAVISDMVIESYDKVRSGAIIEAISQRFEDDDVARQNDWTDKDQERQEALEIARDIDSRIVLYSLHHSTEQDVPAVGFRLFVQSRGVRSSRERGVWRPAKGLEQPDFDKMLILDRPDAIEMDAIAARFWPILEYAEEHHSLPQTDDHLSDFLDEKAILEPSSYSGRQQSPWRPVFLPNGEVPSPTGSDRRPDRAGQPLALATVESLVSNWHRLREKKEATQ